MGLFPLDCATLSLFNSEFLSVQLDFCVCTSGSFWCLAELSLSTWLFLLLADDFLFSLADDTWPIVGGRGDFMFALSFTFLVVLLLPEASFLPVFCFLSDAPADAVFSLVWAAAAAAEF